MGAPSLLPRTRTSRRGATVTASGIAVVVGVSMMLGGGGTAGAAVVPTVGLGTSAAYGALGGSTVTNTGTSVINGLDVGVSPGTAITGFPPGVITAPGVVHAGDAHAANAQAAALTAFNDAAGRVAAPADKGLTDLVGKTLPPGVYQGNLSLSGTVTLDNRTNPDAVFIFQASSTLITASASVVVFTTPHASCNVFWEVATSATLGTNSRFVGTVLAHTSITAQTSATVTGRLLAATGALTLDTNVITAPACALPPATSDAPTTPTRTTASSKPTGPATTITPPNENTTPGTIALLTDTQATTTTTTPAGTAVLTQPSFPTGVSAGFGPPAPTSPTTVIGAALIVWGGLALNWRLPAVRRLGSPRRRRPTYRGGDHR